MRITKKSIRRVEIQMSTVTTVRDSGKKELRPSSVRRFEAETTMKWTMPRIVEVAVGLEINSYACAELN